MTCLEDQFGIAYQRSWFIPRKMTKSSPSWTWLHLVSHDSVLQVSESPTYSKGDIFSLEILWENDHPTSAWQSFETPTLAESEYDKAGQGPQQGDLMINFVCMVFPMGSVYFPTNLPWKSTKCRYIYVYKYLIYGSSGFGCFTLPTQVFSFLSLRSHPSTIRSHYLGIISPLLRGFFTW